MKDEQNEKKRTCPSQVHAWCCILIIGKMWKTKTSFWQIKITFLPCDISTSFSSGAMVQHLQNVLRFNQL